MNRRTVITRRDFLGLAGMAAIAGSVACTGGVAGYLLLTRSGDKAKPSPSPSPVAPTPAGPRPVAIKEIDRPPVTSRADWNARAPDHTAANELGSYSLTNVEGWRTYDGDLRDVYRTVVVHHSALYTVDDVSTMQEIQNQHMDLRLWADIGYHFGVGRSGQVFEGRELAVRGTHVETYNTGSVGVVFFGNFDQEELTWEQFDAGRRLIDWLAVRLELTHLAGHRDFNEGTDCPGTVLYARLADLANSAGLQIGIGGYQPPAEQLTPSPSPQV